MRILLVTPVFPPTVGGIQTTLHETARRLEGHNVEVIAPGDVGARNFDAVQPYTTHRVAPLPAKAAYMRMAAQSLVRARRMRADVVLAGHPYVAPVAAAARRLLGCKAVAWAYGKELQSHTRYLRRWLPPMDAVLVISEHTKNLVSHLGVPAHRTVQVPLGADLPPRSAPSSVNPIMLTISRLDETYKGHDVVLRALPLIRARVPQVEWLVVGDGPLRQDYERLAASLGVRDQVRFLGTVDRATRDELLARCSVLVMVSRAPRGGGEGFGIVYLEANAYGKPVVAGAIAGALDAVVDGETGILVDPEDELDVAEAVVRLLTTPDLAARLGNQGRDRVLRSFTWEQTAHAVEEVLSRCVFSS